MRPVLLCDLDETLVDRSAGFRVWADSFTQDHRLNPDQHRLIRELDGRHPRREEFFPAVVRELGLDQDPERIWAGYRRQMPAVTPAFDGIHGGLLALRARGWRLGLVSNGQLDNQIGKLQATALDHLFEVVVISDAAGLRKPDPAIFQQALEAFAGTERRPVAFDCWVLGDDPLNDMRGGAEFGARTCWISHGRAWPHPEWGPTCIVRSGAEGLRRFRHR